MTKSKLKLVVGGVTMLMFVAACGPKQDAGEYGDTAQEHFVEGCTTERTVTDGELQVDELGSEALCQCVYDNINTNNAEAKYPLQWDALRDYEKEVEKADSGSIPEPPAELIDAVELCTTAGPQRETSPTTTASE